MKITVIGAGNIGGAIAMGAVRAKVVTPEEMTVADPSAASVEKLKAMGLSVNYNPDNRTAVAGADMIVVAVKPWLVKDVLAEVAEVIDRRKQVVVSVAAGVSFAELENYLSIPEFGGIGLYRVVPNTAISIGKSVTFIASRNTDAESDRNVMDLFKALGEVFEINESQITAVTALSSSGIAYAFKYIDSAMQGGVEMGMEENLSLRVVIATMKGALAMLEANGSLPQQEIDKVTTPGGITLKGLEAMEKGGFTQAVINGLLATKF